MNIIDIISESRIDEFFIPGGAQQEFMSAERAEELKIPGAARFRPWGTNTTTWVYSSDNMRDLAIEAMQIQLAASKNCSIDARKQNQAKQIQPAASKTCKQR